MGRTSRLQFPADVCSVCFGLMHPQVSTRTIIRSNTSCRTEVTFTRFRFGGDTLTCQEMLSVVCTLLPEDPYEYMMNHVVQEGLDLVSQPVFLQWQNSRGWSPSEAKFFPSFPSSSHPSFLGFLSPRSNRPAPPPSESQLCGSGALWVLLRDGDPLSALAGTREQDHMSLFLIFFIFSCGYLVL